MGGSAKLHRPRCARSTDLVKAVVDGRRRRVTLDLDVRRRRDLGPEVHVEVRARSLVERVPADADVARVRESRVGNISPPGEEDVRRRAIVRERVALDQPVARVADEERLGVIVAVVEVGRTSSADIPAVGGSSPASAMWCWNTVPRPSRSFPSMATPSAPKMSKPIAWLLTSDEPLARTGSRRFLDGRPLDAQARPVDRDVAGHVYGLGRSAGRRRHGDSLEERARRVQSRERNGATGSDRRRRRRGRWFRRGGGRRAGGDTGLGAGLLGFGEGAGAATRSSSPSLRGRAGGGRRRYGRRDPLELPTGPSTDERAFVKVVKASARITAVTRLPGATRSTSTA